MKKIFYLLIILALFSCERTTTRNNNAGNIDGYVPIYVTANEFKIITTIAKDTPTINAGKIYAYGNYIFQNDIGLGIHIIDNTNKSAPHKIGFIKIAGNSEVAVKGNYLYANNGADLVVIDVSDILNPQVVNRVVNAFPSNTQNYPTQQGVYFECVDETKGVVIGWKKQTIQNPQCYR